MSKTLKKEYQNTAEFLIKVKTKDKLKIAKAVENIKKLKRKCNNFNSISVIREWRNK